MLHDVCPKGTVVFYAAFSLWLFLIFCMGIGLYRLWSHTVRPAWVNWALLPGTVVSETAYIFGCLITGGEVRHAKLMDDGRKRSSSPRPKSKVRSGIIGPAVASLVAIAACGAGIAAAYSLLGEQVVSMFTDTWARTGVDLPTELPVGWAALWSHLALQLNLVRHAFETFILLEWTHWEVALFVYLTVCLAVRFTPVREPGRGTLTAVVVILLAVAVIGYYSPEFTEVITGVWPLLTYLWASLLVLLVVTLLVRAAAVLFATLAGKSRS